MKKLYLLLCASAVTTSLAAQFVPETTHCRMDSMLMIGYHPDGSSHNKFVYTYDGDDYLIGTDIYSKQEIFGALPGEWMHQLRMTFTNTSSGQPLSSISSVMNDEAGGWMDMEKTTYEYDANGNCLKKEEYSLSWDPATASLGLVLSSTNTYSYDDQNRILESHLVQYGMPNREYKYVYSYGAFGLESDSYYNLEEGEWVLSNVSECAYDEQGSMIRETNKYPYDGQWYYTSCQTFTYDENGNMLTSVYSNGCQTDYSLLNPATITNYTYDEKGRVTLEEVFDPYNEGVVTNRTISAYDDHDDLVSQTNYNQDYDPITWEPLPDLKLHEELYFYYKCLSGSSMAQIYAKPEQRGCILMNGKLVIFSGDKYYDLMGRSIK